MHGETSIYFEIILVKLFTVGFGGRGGGGGRGGFGGGRGRGGGGKNIAVKQSSLNPVI